MFEGVLFVRPWTSSELYAKARRWQIVFLISFFAMVVIALIASPLGLTSGAATKLFFAFFGLTVVAVVMDDRITTRAKATLSKEKQEE